MSEQKIKHKNHANILKNSIGCIYCAACNKATQIDHMPPRAMFRLHHRPKGLEFPSCAACNQGTSPLDTAATFMARAFPGIQDEKDSAALRADRPILPSYMQAFAAKIGVALHYEFTNCIVPEEGRLAIFRTRRFKENPM